MNSVMDELEGALNEIALLRRENKGQLESLELQRHIYQVKIRMLEFKCALLTMAVKELLPELYKEILAEYDKVFPQQERNE